MEIEKLISDIELRIKWFISILFKSACLDR